MERIKTVKVSSRRSEKIKNSYFIFEMEVEADVSGFSNADKKEYISRLWKYANDEVDTQIVDAQDM